MPSNRRERRCMEREQKKNARPKKIEGPLNENDKRRLFQTETEVMEGVDKDVTILIKQGNGPGTIARHVQTRIDNTFSITPGAKFYVCSDGCSWCCHQQVSVTPVEAIAIAEGMQRAFPEDWLQTIKQKIASKAESAFSLKTPKDYTKLRMSCAMLAEDGRCSIYPIRPLICRSYFSFSVDSCRSHYENPQYGTVESDLFPLRVGTGAVEGIQLASHKVGREYELYEFHSALLRALEIADASDRWSRGEPVFEGCTKSLVDPDGDELLPSNLKPRQ